MDITPIRIVFILPKKKEDSLIIKSCLVLGVVPGVHVSEIKKAYRKLAHRYHPGKPGGDEKKLKEIKRAYHALMEDYKKRIKYNL